MYYRRLKFCIIYLVLNRGCFEAVLMKNTLGTLGIKCYRLAIYVINFFEIFSTHYLNSLRQDPKIGPQEKEI
jgi:hypothetical protein